MSRRVSMGQQAWMPGDERRHGSFEPVPMEAGHVRISMPDVIHGSTPTTCTAAHRRLALPWYTGIKDDRKTQATII